MYMYMISDKFCDVHGHFVDLRGVVLLDIPQNAHIVICDKINSDSLAAETT